MAPPAIVAPSRGEPVWTTAPLAAPPTPSAPSLASLCHEPAPAIAAIRISGSTFERWRITNPEVTTVREMVRRIGTITRAISGVRRMRHAPSRAAGYSAYRHHIPG